MKNIDVLALDGRLLKAFLAIFETQSVTKAADTLGVSQSSVSHNLNRLRECIGDPLFTKQGRGIAPTYAAQMIAPKVSRIVSQLEGLALQSEYDPRSDSGTFSIATSVTELLPALLLTRDEITAASQTVRLRFIELGDRSDALKVLEGNIADLAITASIGPYPLELSVKRLYQDPIVCFYDPDCRTAPDTIGEYCAARHAVLDLGGQSKSIVERALENSGLTRETHLGASNSYALARLIMGTELVATLPKRLASSAFSGFDYCPAPFPLPPVAYDLVWHRRDAESPRNAWFRNTIIEAISNGPDLD